MSNTNQGPNATAAAVDQFNLYVGSQDINSTVLSASVGLNPVTTATNSILNVVTTATGSNTSQNIPSGVQKGAAFYITIGSLTVNTATLGVNINAIDPLTGTAFPFIRASLDGLAANGTQTLVVYPGINSTLAAATATLIDMPMPANWQLVASLTIATTASMSGTLSYKIGGSKLL